MSLHSFLGTLALRAFPIVAVVLVGLPSVSRAQQRSPRLVVSEPSYNFGSVPQGQRIVHEYELRNAGDGDLTIQRVSPACGCTAAAVSSNVVKPGGTEKIKVEFDTTGFSGAKTKSIQVLTNSVDKSEMTLILTGTVVRGVSLTPERLDFGEINANSSLPTRTKEFTLEMNEGVDFEVKRATSYSPHIAVRQVGAQPRKVTYSVELLPDAPKGELRDRVIVEFEGGKQASVNIPVSANVLADLRVVPSTVSFGIVGGESVIERRVRFENSSGRKVAVNSINSSHPAVSASLVEVEAGKKGVLVVKLDPTRMTGDLKANLDLKTDHPEDKIVSLSVYGIQPPR
ncbi:MAG: hypothetical protein RL326_2180 [Pseudomonadota bacterium]